MPSTVVFKRVFDLFLYLVFCALAGTGLLMAFRLPSGTGRRFEAFGMTRHDWGEIHLWLGIAFLVGIAVHLVLNWNWLTKIAAQKHAWRLWLGLLAGLALLILPLATPVEPSTGERGAGSREERGKGKNR